MSLKKFVELENRVAALFPGSRNIIDINNLSTQDIDHLEMRLESALSPEALTCDGELRGVKLHAKAKMLYTAKDELARVRVRFATSIGAPT